MTNLMLHSNRELHWELFQAGDHRRHMSMGKQTNYDKKKSVWSQEFEGY